MFSGDYNCLDSFIFVTLPGNSGIFFTLQLMLYWYL